MIYIIGDTHFGHANIRGYCGRPDDADDRVLASLRGFRWKDDDILIHLGDFCLGDDGSWHQKFMEVAPRHRVLVKGNHDGKSMGWYLRAGWCGVYASISIIRYGLDLLFSHEPIKDFHSHDINIHAHLHNGDSPGWWDRSRWYLYALEDYYSPISLKEIIRSIRR